MDPAPSPEAPPPPPPPGGEPRLLRKLRRYGILLLVLAAFLPYHGCRAHPSHFEPHRTRAGYYDPEHSAATPAAMVEWFLRDEVLDLPHGDEELWIPARGDSTDDGPGYAVYLAVLPWILLLGIAALGRYPRLAAGVLAWCASAGSLVAIGVSVFGQGYDPLLPDRLQWLEAAAILLGAILLLSARPRHRWGLSDVEATVSSQALLGIAVALYWPTYRYLEWTLEDGHGWWPVMVSLWRNYRIGFWVGLAGLALTAAPLYFSGPRGDPLYHRLFPWPFPSSIPTPTSTSTGSTTTGTPSSTGPGPPGSSPS